MPGSIRTRDTLAKVQNQCPTCGNISFSFRAAEDGPPTEEEHRKIMNRFLLGNGHSPIVDWVVPRGRRIAARIDSGNLIADCEACNSAELVSPSWPVFVCTNCGAGPLRVVIPNEVALLLEGQVD